MQIERISIEKVRPTIDGGEFPVKRVVGDTVRVSADIFAYGVEKVQAEVIYRKKGNIRWIPASMRPVDSDSWVGEFNVDVVGTYEFMIRAWRDRFSLWLENISKWSDVGEDVSADLRDGINMIKKSCKPSGPRMEKRFSTIMQKVKNSDTPDAIRYLKTDRVRDFITGIWKRESVMETDLAYEIVVDPRIASFSSWYELFPRSQTTDASRSGTFLDVEHRLKDIAEMGFNVLYLTPIHPIGTTNRRGGNGTRVAGPGDPGSPWAIGSSKGGHKSINPDLGSLTDFLRLVKNSRKKGIEVAMDIAFQCSPDHPYVKEHPEWFYHRPDGSIRYAENPPKRYYDIYPINFDTDNWRTLWNELKSIFEYWIDKGIRIFRVDNPHTKPFGFWKWLIARIKKKNPDVIFLSEAFTRPRLMYMLSKIGFSQSYSYFTWKNYHYELTDYFTEINQYPVCEYFRPVLFTNTPDILSENLRVNGRPAFMYRAFLAATLSPSWGIYSGYELCENAAVGQSEEYQDSEKYEIRVRNWTAPGNIRSYIGKLNAIRRKLRPLQVYRNLKFLQTDNPNIIAYERCLDKEHVIMAVNLNPGETHSATITLPEDFPRNKKSKRNVYKEYMTDTELSFYGTTVSVSLKPGSVPGMILARS